MHVRIASIKEYLSNRSKGMHNLTTILVILFQKGLGRSIQFASSLILTRILAPADFGIMVTAGIVLQLTQLFSDMGFQTVLIQKGTRMRQGQLDAAFSLALIRGVGLFIIILVCSEFLAGFYQDHRLQFVLQLLAFNLIFQGLENPAFVILIKQLQVGRQLIFETLISMGTLIITVACALITEDFYGLVYGSVGGSCLRTLCSYLAVPRKAQLRWHRRGMLSIWSMGSQLMINSIITYLLFNMDRLSLGRLIGMSELGSYNIGRNLAVTAELIAMQVCARSLLPAFSNNLNHIKKINQLYCGGAGLISTITGTLLLLQIFHARHLVDFLYDSRYSNAAIVVTFLSVRGLMRILALPQEALLFSIGKPGWISLGNGLACILLILCGSYLLLFPELIDVLAFSPLIVWCTLFAFAGSLPTIWQTIILWRIKPEISQSLQFSYQFLFIQLGTAALTFWLLSSLTFVAWYFNILLHSLPIIFISLCMLMRSTRFPFNNAGDLQHANRKDNLHS